MYIPTYHEEKDVGIMHSLIESHPLATWVTTADDGLTVNHIPFFLDSTRGELGTLVAHVARANPVWKALSTTANSVLVFQGAESYITPSWYPSKHAHGKVAPTWNYAVVHAYGLPCVIDDRDWILKQISQLTDIHEAEQEHPWKVSDAPRDFTDKLLQAVVGIEIPIAQLVGKWKVSQNRPDPDKAGVVAGLLTRNDQNSREMASLVNRHIAFSEED